jgi:hypothetical protein
MRQSGSLGPWLTRLWLLWGQVERLIGVAVRVLRGAVLLRELLGR